ncbi:cysteine hydrolase family protein [Novosphingobium sp. 9]|uniref:cysteine hydrolase family protein n=1 Tax=Novosphingobium sp. 9 TaxID=2025349 RepID=UPI0028CB8E60|nr:isochorismatase family protein [Novosphingobium sp. 9]
MTPEPCFPEPRFIVVIDTQHDFMDADGALSVAGADELAAPMREWLAGLDPEATAGVLFTFDTHLPEVYAGSPEAEAFPIHCVKHTHGWENVVPVSAVPAAIPVWRLEKGVFDMWEEDVVTLHDARMPDKSGGEGAGIERENFFAALAEEGVRDVTVIGVAADYCVKWAIDGLLARGFRVTVPAALTKGIVRPIETVAEEDFAGAMLEIA